MRFLYKHKKNKGFTLIESLLVIVLLSIIVSISVPFLQSFQIKNDLEISSDVFVRFCRNAQLYARAVKEDDDWGVRINVGEIVLFKGGDYFSRDISYDEKVEIPLNILITGDNEILFNKLTGLPVGSYNVVFVSSEGITKNILINEKGTINYY